MSRAMCGIALALSLVLSPTPASAKVSDPNFAETVLLSPKGLGGTTAMAWAPDGSNRLFLTRQIGQVKVVVDGQLSAGSFTSLSPIVTDSECGLIGMAFDPAFVDNHYVYFFVSVSASEQQIVRYVAEGNKGLDKTVVVPGLPTLGMNHDGGALGFGPDGKLYWAIGDLGSGVGAGEDLSSLAAKVGRVNADGSVPEDNPFFDGAGPNDDRIWARGFRNPFTLAWQPTTERLWLNVVGAQFEQIFTPVAGDHGGWSQYQNDQPDGYLSPLIAYRTHGAESRELVADGTRRKDGVVTFTTTLPHRFRVGTKLTITGSSDASFDLTGYVSDVPSANELRIPQAGPDASGGGGLASSLAFGAAVTGGTFWDSSAVPEEYRGNFFFTDYVSGRIVRAVTPPGEPGDTPSVTAVDYFATADRPIDMDVGPDGDLYYATFAGGVYRIRYIPIEQAIVVSRLHIRVVEGAHATVGVRLAMPPTESVSVHIQHQLGDPDIVAEPAELIFDAENWELPQIVTIAALEEPDTDPDRAFFGVSSADLETEIVDVRVIENDVAASGGAAGEAEVGSAGEGGVRTSEGGAGEVTVDPAEPEGGQSGVAGAPDGDGGHGGIPVKTPVGSGEGCSCSIPSVLGTADAMAMLGWLLVPALRRARRRGDGRSRR